MRFFRNLLRYLLDSAEVLCYNCIAIQGFTKKSKGRLKMKQSKRVLSVLLAVLMALSALSVLAAAAEPTIPTSGKVSRVLADGTEEKEAIEWSLSDDGTLTITGQGELHAEAAAAWEKLMPSIKKAVIGEGITNIPGGFLNACDTLESVSFPTSLQMISIYTFNHWISLLKHL